MLQNDIAVELYHKYAKSLPIIDYHCHLSPQEILENKSFTNLTEAWLYGDHYKWRAMRANGCLEELVTGGNGVSDYDRFVAYTATLPNALGNPLFHWSHLELQRYFGVNETINEQNAPQIWKVVNEKLNSGQFKTRDLIKMSNVSVICTTDDPIDSLEYHIAIKQLDDFDVQVLPSFRPDKALNIRHDSFIPWLAQLKVAAKMELESYDQLLEALVARIQYFDEVGCKVSDHGMDYVFYADVTKEQAANIFSKALANEQISFEEEQQYKTYTFLHMARWYAKLGWSMQLHMNPSRNNNTRMFKQLGPDHGYDAINDAPLATPLGKLLDALDSDQLLPKTIVYSLNAKDNEILAALIGCFQGGGVAGKMQLGSAWWFNDTKKGMLSQLESLANFGLLGQFVGMLTDSRSFLSFTRHEYFRRILCNLVGEWVEQGEIPADMDWLGSVIENISYYNAKHYFGF